jgi:uncharacterized DUF497 family protein
MLIEYDPAKNAANIRERGLAFDRAADFDFETATFRVDARKNYAETRIRSFGYLDGRIHCLVFVDIPDGIRVISFRKATQREVKRYAQEPQP